jgi:Flp pilus assembly pilin Flp
VPSGPAVRFSFGLCLTGRKEVTQQMIQKLHRLWASMTVQVGQGLAEYALILALIAIVAILALIFLGSQISDKLSIVGSSV